VISVFGTFSQNSVFMSATGQQQTPHKEKKQQVEQVKSLIRQIAGTTSLKSADF